MYRLRILDDPARYHRVIKNLASGRYSDDFYNGGGGFAIRPCRQVSLENNVLVQNAAYTEGAGLHVVNASVKATHNDFASNIGPSAIFFSDAPLHLRSLSMLNNIVVQHSVGIRIQSANIAAFDTTEWGSGSWANEKDWDGALISTIRNEWGDPRFVAPEQEDYHLRNDSHALDRASPSSVMRDIDGQPRLGQPDIGADEYAASVHLPLIARK